jgi:hypothetical protein
MAICGNLVFFARFVILDQEKSGNPAYQQIYEGASNARLANPSDKCATLEAYTKSKWLLSQCITSRYT